MKRAGPQPLTQQLVPPLTTSCSLLRELGAVGVCAPLICKQAALQVFFCLPPLAVPSLSQGGVASPAHLLSRALPLAPQHGKAVGCPVGPLQGAKGLLGAKPQGTKWRRGQSRPSPGGKLRLGESVGPARPRGGGARTPILFSCQESQLVLHWPSGHPVMQFPHLHELVSLSGHKLGLFHFDIPGGTQAGLFLLPRDSPRGFREGPTKYKANLSLHAQGASLDLELSQTHGSQTLNRSQAREVQNKNHPIPPPCLSKPSSSSQTNGTLTITPLSANTTQMPTGKASQATFAPSKLQAQDSAAWKTEALLSSFVLGCPCVYLQWLVFGDSLSS